MKNPFKKIKEWFDNLLEDPVQEPYPYGYIPEKEKNKVVCMYCGKMGTVEEVHRHIIKEHCV
jgi:hypothetical protein